MTLTMRKAWPVEYSKEDYEKYGSEKIAAWLEEDVNRIREAERIMLKFYELFGVEPVAPIIRHKGDEPITVDETLSVGEQHDALWDILVPNSGACETLQGEVIRATGRISNEIRGNGAVNWDNEYKKMLLSLSDYFAKGNALSEQSMMTAQDTIKEILACKAYGCWDAPLLLCDLAVEWVKQNPTPIPLGKVNYRR